MWYFFYFFPFRIVFQYLSVLQIDQYFILLIAKLRMVFTLSKDYLKKLRSGNSLVVQWSGLPIFYC